MKLGESGEAFFVSESPLVGADGQSVPPHMATSPLPPSIFDEDNLRTNATESPFEFPVDTLMGNRDVGMLAETSDDMILGKSFFKADLLRSDSNFQVFPQNRRRLFTGNCF